MEREVKYPEYIDEWSLLNRGNTNQNRGNSFNYRPINGPNNTG